ncbi:MAG: TonB-dependent receptor, partial [Pseudomonadota bacterium]
YDNEAVDLRTSPVSNVQVLPADCLIGSVSCLDVVLGFSPPEEDPQQELDFDAWLPRAAITYSVNDALSLFVSYQRGYRAGGTYLQADISDITERQDLIVREFDAEYLDDYEVGFRFVGLDNRLRFNGNAFYSLYKDQQVSVPGPSGTFVDREILNAAKSRSYGLELEADYIFNEQFDGFASVGLLKAEFRDFPWGLEGSPRENLKGNTLPGAPEVSGTVGLNYTHASGVFVNFSVSYQSAVESDIANLDGGDFGPGLTERTGALTLANSRIGYRDDHFTVYAYATNLFDDETPTTINIGSASQEDESVGLFSNPRYNVTPPRTLGMVVEVSL